MSDARQKLERLCKWRSIFAGWQLGTRVKGDPESDAVRDHREVTILLRAEVSALAALLVAKGVFTAAEFEQQLGTEADHLDAAYQRHFPGFKAGDEGMQIDIAKAARTTKGWRP